MAETEGGGRGVDTFYWRTVPPPPPHTHTSRAGDTFSAAKNIDIAYTLYENITNIGLKYFLDIIHIVCQFVIRPECGFLSPQFRFVV